MAAAMAFIALGSSRGNIPSCAPLLAEWMLSPIIASVGRLISPPAAKRWTLVVLICPGLVAPAEPAVAIGEFVDVAELSEEPPEELPLPPPAAVIPMAP